MNFTVLDETKVKQWDTMLETILQTIEKQASEIKHLKDDGRVLSLLEAGQLIGRGRTWMLKNKDEIGYVQIKCGEVGFRKSKLDAFVSRYEKQSKIK